MSVDINVKTSNKMPLLKRITSFLLCLTITLLLVPSVFAADSGLSNFKKVYEYTTSFNDVYSSSWYAENVKMAYEYGLIQGNSDTTYNPNGNITLAETLALACRLHSICNTGKADFVQGSTWYLVYVDYAVENGIIDKNDYSNYNATATRAQFASILAVAFPNTALAGINTVEDNAIPDVAITAEHASEIYTLYRAGILTGNDKMGTFAPDSNIQRCAVAAIVSRMADKSLRQSITLTKLAINNYLQINSDNGEYYILHENEQLLVTADFGNDNVESKEIEWSSSNSTIATVSNGLVCGKKAGRAEITASYNGISAKCIVLVASIDGIPQYVGKMAFKKDGILYKSSLSKDTWGQKVKYLDENPTLYVYSINGEYYINNVLLRNLADCFYGEAITVYSDNPYIKDPQLSGSADLHSREEWHTDYLSSSVEIRTRTIYVTLPNKEVLSYDFDSLIYINGKMEKTIVYNIHYSDNEVSNGFFYMQSIPDYLEVMKIDCKCYFDSNTKQLIFEIN